MTDVHFSWKQLDGLTNPYKSTSGVVTITPLRYSTEDKTLITDASISKRVTGRYTFKLPPNPVGTFFKFTLEPNDGSPVEEYRLIPDESLVEYVDLSKVDGEANYVDDPSVPAWVAELERLKQSGDFFVSKVEAALDVVSDHSNAAGRHAASAEASADAAKSSATNAGSSATLAKVAAERASAAATLSQDSALSVMPMLSGSVAIAPQGGALAVDLGRAVNVATGLAETSGAVDVTFPDVTTPDGRVNPDGLGTLLQVDTGAERLTWPGGTVMHGTPPEGQAAMASLVRVGGVVTVVWPPDVGSGAGPGVTAQVAAIEKIIGGEVSVQPGGSAVADVRPGAAPPAVFMNPYNTATSRKLVLTVGAVTQRLTVADGNFSSTATHRPGGVTDYSVQAKVTYDPAVGPPEHRDGWVIARGSGTPVPGVDLMGELFKLQKRVQTSAVVPIARDGPALVVRYLSDDPRWSSFGWNGQATVTYTATGDTDQWPDGMVLASGLSLPFAATESAYAAKGIVFPGKFYRVAEFEAMGVR